MEWGERAITRNVKGGMGAYGGYGLRRPADYRPTYRMSKTASIGLAGAFPEVGSYPGALDQENLSTGLLRAF